MSAIKDEEETKAPRSQELEEARRRIAELETTVAERKLAEQEIHLLLTMTEAISKSRDFYAALGVTLGKVCEATGWDFGEAWVPSNDGRVLECSPAWYSSTNSLEKFRQLSKKLTFPPNTGLPGRVWSSKKPEWLPDVSTEPETVFPRTQIALEGGLRAGFGVPITANGQVLTVLVFFMFESREEDNRLIELVSAVGTQLGSVIQRKRAETELRKHQEYLEALWEMARMVDADYQTLCNHTLEKIVVMTESRYSFFGFLNEDESEMTLYGRSSEAIADCLMQSKPTKYVVAKIGLWGDAVRQRRALIINDYQADHPSKKGLPKGHIPLTRIMSVPIVFHGRIVAVAVVANKRTEYTEEDAEQIKAFITNAQVILERRQTEDMLQKQTHDIGERVKELGCLYAISDLAKQDISLEELFRKTVDLLAPAWQYPEVTCARLTLNSQEFCTKNFRETTWKQTSDILADGQRIGAVEVFYLEEKPEIDEGPFLKEERNLINGIARQLGSFIQRKRAEEAKEHLYLMLRTIRNVNQLIIREKNRDRLLKSICDNFIKTRGFSAAWVALRDESGRLIAVAESGWGKDFLPMVRQFKRGEWPDCGQKALRQSAVVVTGESSPTCAGCPLAKGGYNKGTLTVRLEHNGKVYGLLSANLPGRFLTEPQEHSLFEEVARDIAFALHDMELEEERKKAEEEIRKFKTISDHAGYGASIASMEGQFIYVNEFFAEMHGYTGDELIGQHWSILYPEDQIKILQNLRKQMIDTSSNWAEEIWRRKKDGSTFPSLTDWMTQG